MTVRYFKATNGRFTVFRASPTRVYLSATIQSNADHVTDWIFHVSNRGACPAEEITKAEYDALTKLKFERFVRLHYDRRHVAPRDSWVANQ